MTLRKLLGFLIATAGIGLGAFLTGVTAILVAGYGRTAETGYIENRTALLITAAIGAVVSYGIYRFGRHIAR